MFHSLFDGVNAVKRLMEAELVLLELSSIARRVSTLNLHVIHTVTEQPRRVRNLNDLLLCMFSTTRQCEHVRSPCAFQLGVVRLDELAKVSVSTVFLRFCIVCVL